MEQRTNSFGMQQSVQPTQPIQSTPVGSANNVDALYQSNKSIQQFSRAYLTYLSKLLEQLDIDQIQRVCEMLVEAYEYDKQIFFIGNGGSAATASHFSTDLGKGTRAPGKKPFRAISLTDNVSYITAAGNDEGYDRIFTIQLEMLMNPGDLVVGITASGNSPNLVNAFEYAKTKGKTIGILGFDGGKLLALSDAAILVKTPKGEYGPVEDIHMVMDHLLTNYLMRVLREKDQLKRVHILK